MRAEQAEQATSNLQQRFDEQARELAEARARIAELERLLAEARGEQEAHGAPHNGEQPGSSGGGAQPPDGQPGETSGEPPPRPRPATPRPGIMEVRRQLSQALTANAELRALVEELQRRIALLERRCAELEQQLQRALSLASGLEPSASGQADAEDAARAKEHASILTTELEQVRRERAEIAEQRDRLVTRLTSLLLHDRGAMTGPAADYSAR